MTAAGDIAGGGGGTEVWRRPHQDVKSSNPTRLRSNIPVIIAPHRALTIRILIAVVSLLVIRHPGLELLAISFYDTLESASIQMLSSDTLLNRCCALTRTWYGRDWHPLCG
jgi:hypothetical protein